MKLFRKGLLSILGFLLIQNSFAVPGRFFNVIPQGTQFNITTNVPTHPLPYLNAGLVINTPGFRVVSGLGVNCNPDRKVCSFAQIGNNLPVTVKITGPEDRILDLILCLNLAAGQSCQHSFVKIGALKLVYIANSDSGIISKCFIDNLGNLTNCSNALNGLVSPRAIAFNALGNLAYVVDFNGPSSTVVKCSVTPTGDFFGCTSIMPPLFQTGIALNATQPIAYVISFTGNINTCSIDAQGNFINCTVTPSGTTFLSDITLNPAGNFAYIIGTGLFFSDISKCALDANGTILGCTVTNATEVYNHIAINPAGTFAYLSDNNDQVWQCSINGAGDIDVDNCVATAGFDNPQGLVVNSTGTSLYVTNSDANKVSQCSLNPVSGAIILPCVNSGSGLNAPFGLAFLNLNS